MTSEEYFRRMVQIVKKEGPGPKMDMNEGFKGFMPVLDILSREEKLKSGDLAERLGISTARMASILNNLEMKGYARRCPDEKDKRVTLAEITPEGEEFLTAFRKEKNEKMDAILKDIPDADMETFFNVIEKLMHGMCPKKEEEHV